MSKSDLEQQQRGDTEPSSVSRRDVIKRGLVIGGATYMAPSIIAAIKPLETYAATPTPTPITGAVNLSPCTVVLQRVVPATIPVFVGTTGTVIGVIQPVTATQTQSQSQSQSASATATASSTIAVRIILAGGDLVNQDTVAAQSHEGLVVRVFDEQGNEIQGLGQRLQHGANGTLQIDVQGTANASARATTVQVQQQTQTQVVAPGGGLVIVPVGTVLFQAVLVPCIILPTVVLPIGTVTRTVTQTVTQTATLPACNFALVPTAILGPGVTGVANVVQSGAQTQSQTASATATASSSFKVRLTIAGLSELDARRLIATIDGGGDNLSVSALQPPTTEAEFFALLRLGLTGTALAAVNAQIALLESLNAQNCRDLAEITGNASVLARFVANPANLSSDELDSLNSLGLPNLLLLAALGGPNLILFVQICLAEHGTGTGTGTGTVTGTGTGTVTGTGTGTGTVTQTVTQTVTGTVTQTVTQTVTGTVTQTVTLTGTTSNFSGIIIIEIEGTANASAAATTVQVQTQQQTQAVNVLNPATPIVIPAGTLLFSTVITNFPCIFR